MACLDFLLGEAESCRGLGSLARVCSQLRPKLVNPKTYASALHVFAAENGRTKDDLSRLLWWSAGSIDQMKKASDVAHFFFEEGRYEDTLHWVMKLVKMFVHADTMLAKKTALKTIGL